MFSIVIKGGMVVDPAQGLHELLDVGVEDGKIAEVARELSTDGVGEVIDASGKIVTPGLIDLHTHVFRGDNHRDPDEVSGIYAGVTTLVDAGGAAPDDIERFRRVIADAKTTVYSFLGTFNRQAGPWEEIAADKMPAVAKANPELVKGVKIHSMPLVNGIHGIAHIKAAKRGAVAASLPLMLHIGDIGNRELPATTSDATSRALDLLERGDIVTHLFSPLTGSATDEDLKVLPALRAARERGVWMDSSVGDYQFGWRTAEALVEQGFYPDTIATDIEIHSNMGRTDEPMVADGRITGRRVASERTMVEYMANFFKLGFSLNDIIRMSTQTPAKVLGIEDIAGSLKPGMPADISVLQLVDGRYRLTDATGESRVGSQTLIPIITVKNGVSYEAGAGAHEWGFAPPTATEKEAAALR